MGSASVGEQPVFAFGQIHVHAPVFVGEKLRVGHGASLHVASLLVIDEKRQAMYLRGESVGELHVVVIDETQTQPFGTRVEVIVNDTATR